MHIFSVNLTGLQEAEKNISKATEEAQEVAGQYPLHPLIEGEGDVDQILSSSGCFIEAAIQACQLMAQKLRDDSELLRFNVRDYERNDSLFSQHLIRHSRPSGD